MGARAGDAGCVAGEGEKMSNGTQRMTLAQLAASGGLANLRSSASGTPLRDIWEAAITKADAARNEAKPAVTEECSLCEMGFPLRGDDHWPTQRLGMIPVTRCRKLPVAQDARKPADAAPTKGESSQKPLKRKSATIKPPTEYEEQVELFVWADRMFYRLPELDLLFATINGAKMPYGKNKNGHRFSKEAMRQKKAGLKSGVPDLILPVARRDYYGLFIELKRAKKSLSVVSDEQKQWIEKLTARGYLAVICYGAEEAKAVILNYLGAK